MSVKVGGFLRSLLLSAILLISSNTLADQFHNVFTDSSYDHLIKKWSEVYLPHHPWYWNKAQLIAESALNPNAVSWVGAMGLGQFMPRTWEQMERELGWKASPFSEEHNIQASVYYMSTLIKQFKAERPYTDKYSLALSSYNAGLGNVLKAQRLGGNSLLYAPMQRNLHRVTGIENAKQTTDYVNRVWEYIIILERIENE